MTVLLLLAGLALLLTGGTALVSGASGLARHYGISPLIVGLTVVAFGTSAPELMVNIVGALRDQTEIAFGNVVGSNLANLGLVLGIATLIKPVAIEGQIVRREIPLLLLGTITLAVMVLDRPLQGLSPMLSRSDGLILLLLFSIFVYISVRDFLASRDDALISNIQKARDSLPAPRVRSLRTQWYYVVAGVVALVLGGQLTIEHGAELAVQLGVSPLVIGLLVVAVGTSLPELVTSVIAALKNEPDLCVGNVVGSNIFNSLVVLPISALIRPIPIPEGGLLDIFIGLAFAVGVILVFFHGEGRMNRKMGLVFVVVYFGYMIQRVML